jgi:drug/metabolite transporter (DMT)-like permease
MVRRFEPVDVMLFVTVALWSLNFTASKYVLTHGFQPLVYSSIRYGLGAVVLVLFTFVLERSVRIAGIDFARLVLPAAALLFVNQYSFVYALKYSSASTVALVLGSTPIFVGIFAWATRLERVETAFWLAAVVSFVGVALVAAGAGNFSGNAKGAVIAIGTAASWAAYSLMIVPLMRRYSAYRSSSIVMLTMSVAMVVAASPQLADQSFEFTTLTWVAFAYSILGPVVVAHILWFTAVDCVGAGRAAIFANAQPFLAVIFAILLIDEHLARLELVGGFLIAVGIVLERRGHVVAVQHPPAD